MPTINIPPVIRFVLYLLGSISLLTVSYAVDKSWAGDAEVRYVTGLAGLLFILAAAKTGVSDNAATVTGTVVSETGETGAIKATIGTPDADSQPYREYGVTEDYGVIERPADPSERDPHR